MAASIEVIVVGVPGPQGSATFAALTDVNWGTFAGGDLAQYDAGSGKVIGAPATTDTITEGARLYYTDARARAAISATSPVAYNPGTGTISLTYTPVNKAGDTMTGALGVVAGTVAAPGVYITGDTNTGVAQLGGADTLSLVTGGAERLLVNASGNVVVGSISSGRLGVGESAFSSPLNAKMVVRTNQVEHGFKLRHESTTQALELFGVDYVNTPSSSTLLFNLAAGGAGVMLITGTGASYLNGHLNLGQAASQTTYRLQLASGNLNLAAGDLYRGGVKVVGAQGAAVADAAGGATVDAEARTAINTLLARLRAHGLIAT